MEVSVVLFSTQQVNIGHTWLVHVQNIVVSKQGTTTLVSQGEAGPEDACWMVSPSWVYPNQGILSGSADKALWQTPIFIQ
jgi:hypothetical protein